MFDWICRKMQNKREKDNKKLRLFRVWCKQSRNAFINMSYLLPSLHLKDKINTRIIIEKEKRKRKGERQAEKKELSHFFVN